MYHYTIIQWLFFFYFYCFCGWCFESSYVSLKEKKLTNRGFIRGPFLPIYGSGATMMLVVSGPFRHSIVLTYLAGCVGATALEYVTAVIMEALFKVRYWDYSGQRFHFQGRICLSSTLVWGFFTIAMTRFVHVYVEKLMLLIPGQILMAVTLILTAGIFTDFVLAFKTAADLRIVLAKMQFVKEELRSIQKRLDTLISHTGEGLMNRREAFTDSVKEELAVLKAKYSLLVDSRRYPGSLMDFLQRSMLRSNPGMTSVEYRESLEELKEKAREKEKKPELEKADMTENPGE